MISNKKYLVYLSAGLTIVLAGCNYRVNKIPVAADSVQKDATNANPDFSTVLGAIFKPKCLECHSAAGGNRAGVNLESYAQVMKNLADVKADIDDNSMPKDRAPLTTEEKNLLMTWILAGAPEKAAQASPAPVNVPAPSGSPVPTGPGEPGRPTTPPGPPPPGGGSVPPVQVGVAQLDFVSVQKFVLQAACLKCHSAPRNSGDVNLETYADVIKNAADIKKDIEDGSMPKKGTLSSDQKKLILAWIAAGAPETAKAGSPTIPIGNGAGTTPGQPVETGLPGVDSHPENAPGIGSVERDILLRGKYLFNLSSCSVCHTSENGKFLAGGKAIPSTFGTFYTPNITPSVQNGIGAWSEKDFLRAMREGINPKGENYYPAFPYASYSKLTDADILAIRSFIMTFPSVEQENKAHIVKFPLNQRSLLTLWKTLNFTSPKQVTEQNFMTARGPYRDIAEKDMTWNRGAYLVEGPMHCTQCHTPRDQFGGLRRNEWMAGAPLAGSKVAAPNLTPDTDTGVGKWSKADWTRFFADGTSPDGSHVGGEMRQIVQSSTSQLSAADRTAVINYFQGLKAVTSKASEAEPDLPAPAVAQGQEGSNAGGN